MDPFKLMNRSMTFGIVGSVNQIGMCYLIFPNNPFKVSFVLLPAWINNWQ